MSFKEKSIWVSLIVTIIIFGFYFVFAFTTIKNNSAEAARTSLLGIFIGTIILITVIQIILHIVLAITFRNEAVKGEDEREKLIELRATRISYFFLVAGVWISGLSLFFALFVYFDCEYYSALFYSRGNCGIYIAALLLPAGILR